MHIRDLRVNMPGKLAAIVASGKPEPVTRYRHDYAYIVPASTWNDLQQELEVLRRLADTIADQQDQEAVA